ncbi:MAG: DUF2029 domain-containing protein [Anaerolineaceae bacterium]|nr:MAG: DUF2029 domain-containing protein [Anaerolineaceae bacterium]
MLKQTKFSFRDFQILLALTLLGLILAAGLVTLNWWLAGQFGTGADFLPAWNGARAFLFEDANPYGGTIAESMQRAIYGRASRAGEHPFALDVPFPLLILFFPLALIPDPTWARAVWLTLSEIGLVLLVIFSLRLTDWTPRRWFSVLLLAFALAWFFSVSALLDGSFSILLTLALVGALFSMRGFKDELAGFLLAITAMKWEMTLLPWVLLILAVLTARRWRVFIGTAMTWFVLGAIAFLIYPDWFWPYARAAAANWRADDLLTPTRFLSEWIPNFGASLSLLIVSVLLLILVIEWFSALRGKDYRRVVWVFALAIAATPLLGFSNTFANLAPLVFSFAFILPFAWERWEKRPYLILTIIVFLFFVFPLGIRYLSVPTFLADGLIFLLPPVLTLLGLYWVRWYVVHPPRTWLDGVRREVQK